VGTTLPHSVSIPEGPVSGPRRPRVLLAVYAPEPAWSLPDPLRDRLARSFPGVSWSADPGWHRGYGPDLEDADAAFLWHLPPEDLARAGRLRWVHSAATGVRRLLYPEMRRAGVTVTCSRGVHARFMAEHVLAWILAHYRRLSVLRDAQREKRWAKDALLAGPRPASLRGRTVVVAGYGAAGAALAGLLAPFAVTVIGIKRDPGSGGEGAQRIVGGGSASEVAAALGEADVVVNALPNTDATALWFDAERLAAVKPGAFFVNVGRGATVDEAALAAALETGKLSGAGLDVFAEEPLAPQSPLWELNGVQIAPHVAGYADTLWEALTQAFADNLERFLAERPLHGAADFDRGY